MKIWIEDDDRDISNVGFEFTLKEENETPKGMIEFDEPTGTSKERSLYIVSSMDRESEAIRNLNGILTYTLTVSDMGNHTSSMKVSPKVLHVNYRLVTI